MKYPRSGALQLYRTPARLSGRWEEQAKRLAIAALLTVACGGSQAADTSDSVVAETGDRGAAGAGSQLEPLGWCDVAPILAVKCARCHSQPPAHGAPFALVGYEDTLEPDRDGTPRFERIAAAVDEQAMPPSFIQLEPPVMPLSDDERRSLLDWLGAGAPRGAAADCE